MKQNIKKYRIIFPVFVCLVLSFIMLNCSDSNDEEELIGNWVRLSDFDGVARSNAVGFAIGDKGYVGTGYTGEVRLNDFWEYDPVKNTWMQKASLPGPARNDAVGFGTETKGYIGTGYDGISRLNDFYEYDPSTNTWTKKADFAGSARVSAVAFCIGTKGYIATGYDGNYLKDFWEYDTQTDTWTQKVSYGGYKRRDAVAFVVNGKAYICTGINNGSYVNDLWEYDPEADLWTQKRSISNVSDESYDNKYTTIVGTGKVAFAVMGKGYVVAGGQGSVGSNTWEYNPANDVWTEKTSFEGSARFKAVGFGIGNRGYVTTGKSSSYYFDDIWGFDPEADYNEDD